MLTTELTKRNWPPKKVKKLTFRALALRQSDRVNAQNVSFFTLYGGQFMFLTQLLTLNYLLPGNLPNVQVKS